MQIDAGRRVSILPIIMLLGMIVSVWGLPREAYSDKARDTEVVSDETALDSYVKSVDDVYGFTHEGTTEVGGVKIHILNLTSQTWRSEEEVAPNVWRHWITLYVPSEVEVDTGLLFISGGSTDRGMPDPDPTVGRIALATKSVIASLRLVPNQPLVFKDDPDEERSTRGRYEDEIISYSWRKYLDTGDTEWVVQLPMVKSAVRAMDAVQEFLKSEDGGEIEVTDFVVTGASKRGWTTWLTAAVDDRVKAIIPIVIDLLNMGPSFQHHWECYGFWAPSIQDYVDQDLMREVFEVSEAYTELIQLVDPYAYRERLTLPKFLLNASQDEFFLPDSAQFYWDGLEGPKHIRYVPNVGHNVVNGTDAIESLAAYYGAILYDVPLPEIKWTQNDNKLTVFFDETREISARLWQATNPESRDFRTATLETPWKELPLVLDEAGVYTIDLAAPEQGWTAQFVELKFKNEHGLPPFTFTTQVVVTPDTKPFADTQP